MADRSLAGRVVLLTRPDNRNAGLAALLQTAGARVVCHPTVLLGLPDDPEPARAAVDRVADYDWILFTSTAGVRFFLDALRASTSGLAGLARHRLAAVGPATAQALCDAGLKVSVTAGQSRAAGLAAALKGQIVPTDRLLLVSPQSSPDPVLPETIRGSGATLDVVPFYRNTAPAGLLPLVQAVAGRNFDAIVFASPSALTNLLAAAADPESRQLREGLALARLVSIGPTTATAIEREGLVVAARAERPTDEGLADAVCGLF